MLYKKRERPFFLPVLQCMFILLLAAGCGQEEQALSSLSLPDVHFTVSPTKDTTIFGAQGTRIFIEKESFQFADGSPATDSVKIELKEFYKNSDIIMADLSTSSDGRLLETGGMLHISATANGKQLGLKKDKRMVVHFPKQDKKTEGEPGSVKMDLFYSATPADTAAVTNWEVDTVSLFKSTVEISSWGYYWIDMNDSTPLESKPKNFIDTGYNYWNPLQFYVNKFNFSAATINELKENYTWNSGSYINFDITTAGKIKNVSLDEMTVSAKAKKEITRFIYGLPELTPGKDKNGNIVERKAIIALSKGLRVPLFKTSEEYIRSFDKKYRRFEKTPIKNMDDAELNYYIFSVGKLGWINCDRFLDTDTTTDYIVDIPAGSDIKLKMVFKDIKGVLMADKLNGKYIFKKVPVGRQVTIIGIKKSAGLLETVFKEIKISNAPLEKLDFAATSIAALQQQLEKLN